MKNMKKMAVLLLSGMLLSQPIIAGGIPVVDQRSIFESIERGKQLATQIQHQISQLTELQNQVKAMSGTRDVGSVARSTLDTVSGIGSEWADLYGGTKVTGNVNEDLNGRRHSHANNLMQILRTQQLNIKSLEEAQTRMNHILELGRQAAQTQDIKAAADFANRIAIEQGYVQAMQMKLDMAERIARQQETIQEQRYLQQQKCFAEQMGRSSNPSSCS